MICFILCNGFLNLINRGGERLFNFQANKSSLFPLNLAITIYCDFIDFNNMQIKLENLKIEIINSCKGPHIPSTGHHHGIAVDVAAYTLGAEWFERHFTLDRTWKGTDQVFSLEPTGMRKLARDLRATKSSLTYKTEDILDIEKPNGGYEKYKEE